jgi:alpha-L-arabinofuranosidase
VYIGEYASWGNKMKNALSEAAYMTAIERNGDVVSLASYAPLLAKSGFTQWNPNMIYFDNTSVYPTVNYYVQQLFSVNQGDTYFENVVSKNNADSTLAASCVQDSNTGDVILKLVNAGPEPGGMKINLSAFGKLDANAAKTVLSGSAESANVFGSAPAVVPVTSVFNAAKTFAYTAPPMSLTVIRVRKKK